MERRGKARMCKVVLLGDAGSGKTCLLERFLHDTFDFNTKPTIGAAFGTKTLTTENGPVSLQIWDTAGQERYLALANLYYRNANAAVVCCDLTDHKSFQRMEYWIKQVRNAERNCKIYVCGNKADLIWDNVKKRAINTSDLGIFKTTTFETSSKISYNVFTLFQEIANDMEFVNDGGGVSTINRQVHLDRQESRQSEEDEGKKCCQATT